MENQARMVAGLVVLFLVGCSEHSPARKMKYGPPPPGYIKIVGEPVPDWKPSDMFSGPRGRGTVLGWYPIGPRPILSEVWSGNDDASGRVVSIAPHPTDADTVYIASASGGIWKTMDGGGLWVPLTDELSILNHGCVALDPSAPDTVYAGTGEYTTGSTGDGLFRSTDGGTSWVRIATSAQVGTTCSRVVVDPADPLRIHLTGNGGYKRSIDGGASWSTPLSGSASDLAINPANPSVLYVGRHGDGVYRSTNGGASWSELTNGLPASGFSRILVAVAASNPDTVYTAIINGSNLEGLYKSIDGGDSWVEKTNTPNFPSPQAWYDAFIGVDPSNEDIVYCGGVFPSYAVAGVIKTTNGGDSWIDITYGSGGNQLHPDQHAVAFGPGGVLWVGNDGGVWKSNNGGSTWINTNATLTVTQNYTIAVNPLDPDQVMAGTQDNGTVGRETDSEDWPQVIGGDGGFLAYDFVNPSRRYTTYVYLTVYRFLNGGYNGEITGPWGGDPVNFIAPLVMDPNDSQNLLGGTNRVWRTQNADSAADWVAISTSSVSSGGRLNAIAVAPGASNTIYTGSTTGAVYVTTDASVWNNRSSGLPGGQVSDLFIHPTDPGIAYVSFHNLTGHRVFRTEDYGANWTSVTGDMTSGVSCRALEVNWRFDPPHLYWGSGAGVYSSTNGGANWLKDGLDLPNVNIGDLLIDRLNDTITAGTYGRGAWRSDLPSTDCNQNGRPDSEDIACGFGNLCQGIPGSADCNSNSIPDECEALGGDICPPDPNPMTFAVPPTTVSQTEITMTATTAVDPEGENVEYFFDKIVGLPGSDSGWISNTTFDATGLRPNSNYLYTVRARDNSPDQNETVVSAQASAATLIESPTTVSFGTIAGTSIEVTADGTFTDLVSGSSGLFFEMTPAAGSGANVWVQSQTITVTGLALDTNYSFRVKARNLEGVEAGWSSPDNATTLDVATPGAPILSNPTANTADLDIDTNGNGGGITYAIQCATSSPLDAGWDGMYAVHASGLPAAGEDWQTAGGTITLNGLLAGTTYEFHVKARNAALVQTPFGPTAPVSTFTLQVPGAPVLGSATTSTLDLDIDPNGNPVSVEYAIQCSGTSPADVTWDGLFVIHAGGMPSPTEDWQTDSGIITVTGLSPNTVYDFQVKAGTPAGSESGYGPTGGGTTLALAPGAPLLTPGVSPPTTMAIDVVPDTDPVYDNPADTAYSIRCSSSSPLDSTWDGRYVDGGGSPSAGAVWQTDGDWGTVTATGLQVLTSYTFEVVARNRDLLETSGRSSSSSTDNDCNANSIGDAEDIASCVGDPSCSDCNSNGIPDDCDVGGPLDQWGSTVFDFSSEYNLSPPSYLAIQALGAPDVPFYGDHPKAWSPLDADAGVEHLTLGYVTEVLADGITVRENLNNGFVTRLDVVKASDSSLVEVWPLLSGETDPSVPGALADFTVNFSETTFTVSGVKVTIDTTTVPGDWEEIDAIQLRGRAVGTSLDGNGNGIPDECESVPCLLLGDIDGNGLVDGEDINGYVRVKLGTPLPGDDVACADFGNGDVTLDTADFVDALIN